MLASRNGLHASTSLHSHIGSAPLYLAPTTKLTILPFPPMVDPSKRQPPHHLTGSVTSIKVEGPLGTVIVPLRDFVKLNWEEANKLVGSKKKQQTTNSTQQKAGEEAEPRKLTLSVDDATIKIQRGTWGLTRAILANAIEGVQEGHTIKIRMVGVGYRAAVDDDPFPRLDKFEEAFAQLSEKYSIVGDEEQRNFYLRAISKSNDNLRKKQRLSLRLGYSHPVFLPVPRGISCTTPQPTQIVLKGADKEALGLFAANIRKLRPPEPYKGKGVFVGDETIKLKAARKK
ncbi:ribosomal protein L6 [Meira miltonrushii]|uniref:Ribosomal protein L6 n=1 Tax=Meira miltonrushii TaxID=1280837 RepID=A0A316VIN6_9BASI|nr:ribosomal protein L6 [Meira miltonrushii]PWN37370.1 ribosomal protein L6 [Meira miltonrushii]